MSFLEHDPAAAYDEPGGIADAPAAITEPAEPEPSLWRSAIFLKFWVGQSVSKFGDQFNLLAMPLLILALTHSPFALGIAEAANLVPYLLLGLPAGALIDRLPRRIVMMICDIARTLIFAALAVLLLTGWLTEATIWAIYVAIALT